MFSYFSFKLDYGSVEGNIGHWVATAKAAFLDQLIPLSSHDTVSDTPTPGHDQKHNTNY